MRKPAATDIEHFASLNTEFDELKVADKIRHLAYFLHEKRGLLAFSSDEIRDCFKALHLEVPDLSSYFRSMLSKSKPDFVKRGRSFALARHVKQAISKHYDSAAPTVFTPQLLSRLPDRVNDPRERAFLHEAMSCYRVGAYRACVVMTWNLAYDHLMVWLLADSARLAAFNAAVSKAYPKKASLNISKKSDFAELKESETVEICRVARLLSKNAIDILREKLTRRNIAAHPSDAVITQHQADDCVSDLVINVVAQLQI